MWDMPNPAELLIWNRGLSEAEQVRRAEISNWIPPEQWSRLLAVQDERARHQEFDAICRGYAERWEAMNDQRAHSYDSPLYGTSRVDKFHAHLTNHWQCPGINACRDFNPREQDDEATACPHCGYVCKSPGSLAAHIHRRHEGTQ